MDLKPVGVNVAMDNCIRLGVCGVYVLPMNI